MVCIMLTDWCYYLHVNIGVPDPQSIQLSLIYQNMYNIKHYLHKNGLVG